MAEKIYFFSEGTAFNLPGKQNLRKWLVSAADNEGRKVRSLNYIFCNDEALLEINRSFLNHDFYTDIITFDHSDGKKSPVEGEIYISIDRVRDNSFQYNNTFERELHRVMVHGVLHLCGYQDKSSAQTDEMRTREDFYLAQLDLK